MTYVMVWIAVCLSIGIAVVPLLPVSPAIAWLILGSAFVVVLAARRAPRGVRVGVLLLAALLLGLVRSVLVPTFPDWLVRRASGIREATGIVASYPDISEDTMVFTLNMANVPGNLLVRWSCTNLLTRIHYGDAVRVAGNTQLPEAFDGFDYPAYLARRGIVATLYADDVITMENAAAGRWSLWAWGDRLRQRLLLRLRQALPTNTASMAQSLMFGDRSALAVETEEAFSRTGLMHLLAVSGLHLGIFLGGAWLVLRRMGLRPRLTYPLVGVLVLLALVVVGPRVSLVRAGLLFAFLALGSVLADCGLILRRWIHPLNGLAAAAIALLLIRPGTLYDAGFQLTIAATGSILIAFSPSGLATRLLAVQRRGFLGKVSHGLLRLLAVSAAAQAGAAPVIAWHFQAFHPLSIGVNLVAVPLAGASLWAGLLALPLAATSAFPWAVAPFALLLRCLERLVRGLAEISIAELPAGPGVGVWMAGCVGFVYLAAYYRNQSVSTREL